MSTWDKKVKRAWRKLGYQKARKMTWGRFWSVGFYGWLWNASGRPPAMHVFGIQAADLDYRMIRIEQRYMDRKMTLQPDSSERRSDDPETAIS